MYRFLSLRARFIPTNPFVSNFGSSLGANISALGWLGDPIDTTSDNNLNNIIERGGVMFANDIARPISCPAPARLLRGRPWCYTIASTSAPSVPEARQLETVSLVASFASTPAASGPFGYIVLEGVIQFKDPRNAVSIAFSTGGIASHLHLPYAVSPPEEKDTIPGLGGLSMSESGILQETAVFLAATRAPPSPLPPLSIEPPLATPDSPFQVVDEVKK